MTITAQVGQDTLQFPDGTSQEVIDRVVKQHVQGSRPAEPAIQPQPAKQQLHSALELNDPDIAAANPVVRAAAGMASLPLAGMQMLEKTADSLPRMGGLLAPWRMLGVSAEDALRFQKEHVEKGREKLGYEGTDVPYLAGSVAAPIAGGAKLSVPATLLGRMMQGGALGGTQGLLTPVDPDNPDFVGAKAEQAGIGATVGAAIPPVTALASKAGGMLYHGLVEPWLNPAAIKGRAYLASAGDAVEEIKRLLMQNRQIVSGSAPTAGEAAAPAGRAEFSALQETAKAAKPSQYLAREDAQNQARLDAIREFAGTPAKRAEATAARSAAAGPHYELGESQRLPFDVLTFGELNARPSMQASVKRAQRLIQEQTGQKINLPDLAKNAEIDGSQAQKIKLAFDDLIKLFPKSGMDTKELEAIKATRGKYVEWMEANFPALREARRTYKEMSAPVNQMDVGEGLLRKLEPALRDDSPLKATGFANAVRDSASTIKKATGEPRFTELEQVLTGRQLNLTHNVLDDLARSDRHLQMARKGVAAGPDAMNLATSNFQEQAGGKLPHFLHRGVILANAIIDRLQGRVDKKLAAEMATEMLDPPKVAQSIAEAQARAERNKVIAEQIQKLQRAGGQVGAAVAAQSQ